MEKRYALLSVYDKKDIIYFSTELTKLGYSILSTGGTARILQEGGVELTEVSELTGFPEMLDGRVKTLHPIIHAGILAKRDDPSHMSVLKEQAIDTIDIVCCNLYPFEDTIANKDAPLEEVIENIDIGGPTLIRAAAKNYNEVMVITDPRQYDNVIQQLKKEEGVDTATRQRLAVEAFGHTAQYDSIINTYFRERFEHGAFPENLSIALRSIATMRYGENPHQAAAFYQTLPPRTEPCVANVEQLHGKALSFNNILDSDCAIECIKEFTDPTCVIIKHATPCGIASAENILQAWKDAYSTDTYSPFGGIISFNREVSEEVAEELSKLFLEVIIAPEYSKAAQDLLSKKKNLRLLKLPTLSENCHRCGVTYRSVVGGMLAQERDTKSTPLDDWKVVTKKQPTESQLRTMEFAIKCVKHVKSNSVVFVTDTQTVGIGGGQTARVDATWIATHKGKEFIKGSTMASDAFFPFRDGIDVAAEAGVTAIIQPGGSIRDEEVIKAANEHGISMVFTGQRYFRH